MCGPPAALHGVLTEHRLRFFLADNNTDDTASTHVTDLLGHDGDSAAGLALCLSNEAAGAQAHRLPELLGLSEELRIATVPMRDDADSLNVAVAAGILMYIYK